MKLSPLPVGSVSSVNFLLTLYSPEEWIFIGDVYDKRVFRIADLVNTPERLLSSPHIIPNPVTGKSHRTKAGKLSTRCDAAIQSFRFVLVEFDEISKDDQFSFWITILKRDLLPVSTIIDSGGKSLHAWLKVDLPNRQTWDTEIANKLYDKHEGILTLLGADPACKNPSRLSRMPGHVRNSTGNLQKLLYLNSNT